MSAKNVRVAIDGPAGAGKSTVSRRLAERLGFVLVDTGALYRTVALAARRAGADWDDEQAVAAVARGLVEANRIAFRRIEGDPAATGGGLSVLLGGDDVSEAIRTPDMSLGASRVSAIPAVRAALLDLQRQAGRTTSVVLEGRDIGTVVFPDAEVKFFLTASAEIRARRRYDELRRKGQQVDFDATLRDVVARDKADSERAVAPLCQAADAVFVDSSGRSIDEVVAEMEREVARVVARLG